jgi:hypothetical protein
MFSFGVEAESVCMYIHTHIPFMLIYVYVIIYVYYDILTPYCCSRVSTYMAALFSKLRHLKLKM